MPGAYLWGYDENTGLPVKCKVTAAGKLIINPEGFLENPPTEDLSTKAATSEWSFDHNADASRHHAKYTDVESRAAINDIWGSDGKADKDIVFDGYKQHEVRNLNFIDYNLADAHCEWHYKYNQSQFRIWMKNASSVLINVDFVKHNGTAYVIMPDANQVDDQIEAKLENPPTEDVVDKAPTSEWAFDHNADAAAHHAKYTDDEAALAPGTRTEVLSTGAYYDHSLSGISIVYLSPNTGDLTMGGFSGGVAGQIVWFVRINASNTIIIDNNSSHGDTDQPIYTKTAGDETQAANQYGGYRMICWNNTWYIDRQTNN